MLNTTLLTENQEAVYKFLRNHISLRGYAPSLSEMQKLLGIKTKRGVVQYLEALEKKGLILRSSKARGIKIVDDRATEKFENIPIIGYANAGQPLSFAFQDRIGSLKVDKTLLPYGKKIFALIIKGDSMNQRKINYIKMRDGNYILISREDEIIPGDVVLAVIDDTATVKTYTRSSNMIILSPESDNPVHKPIYLNETSNAFINGKVIGVLENTIK